MVPCEGEFSHDDIIKCSKRAIIEQTKIFSYIGILFIVCGIMFIIFKFTKILDLSFLSFVILGCGILIVALPYIVLLFTPKILKRQNSSIIDGFKYKYEFNEENFYVLLESDNLKSENTLKYTYIYKTFIVDDVLMIYLNSNITYLLKLSDFNNDNEKDEIIKKISKVKK